MRQEGAAPGRLGVGDAAADDLGGQPANGTPAHVEQAGLAGERLAVLGDAHDVPRALADTACGEHVHDGVVTVEIVDLLAEPAGDAAQIHLGFHHHPARHDVQAAGEAQQRGDLCPPGTDGGDVQTTQLVLHLGCHRHRSSPLAPSGRRTRPGCQPGSVAAGPTVGTVAVGVSPPLDRTASSASASLAGSCKGLPGRETS